MSNFENELNLLNSLAALLADSSDLRWERASVLAIWGTERLKKGDVDGALRKFRECVEEKKSVLASVEADDAGVEKVETQGERSASVGPNGGENEGNGKSDATSRNVAWRVELAENYLGIARLERMACRFDEARVDCEAALEALRGLDGRDVPSATRVEADALFDEASRAIALLTEERMK